MSMWAFWIDPLYLVLSIVVFGLMVLFSGLTLPVEIGARRRALVMLYYISLARR